MAERSVGVIRLWSLGGASVLGPLFPPWLLALATSDCFLEREPVRNRAWEDKREAATGNEALID